MMSLSILNRRLGSAQPAQSKQQSSTHTASSPHRSLAALLVLLSAACLSAPLQANPLNKQTDQQSIELLQAAKAGEAERALQLLDGADDPDIAENDGTSALHWAVRHHNLELAEALLKAGADINARSRYGITAIYLAAMNGKADMLTLLLEHGANVNETFNEGETVLMTAARTGDYDSVKRLLEHGAEVDARENWHGQTALMWAAAQGHPQLIPLLAEYGADVNAASTIEEWERQVTDEPREKWLPPGGMTPLLFAAREGCDECVAPLLELGADIDATTPKLISPLLISIINGYYDVAWELIQAGADVNIVDDTGRGPLYAAVWFNSMPESNRPSPQVAGHDHSAFDLIEALLEHGADVNAQLSKVPPFRLKLDRGVDSMVTAGTTPFLIAAKSADLAAMKILLEYGADPTLSTDRGIDPLMTAANHGAKESDITGRYKTEQMMIDAIQLCLDQGMDINAKDNNGQGAAFGAATFGLNRVLQFLHDNGAELDYQDNKGLSPLDAASGKAGGYGFAGIDGVYHEETVALIESIIQ